MSTWNPYQVVLMRTTLAAPHPLPFGPDTCKTGFVWREAIPDNHVCVAPGTRSATWAENHEAEARREADGAFGPDTCRPGFVWREAFEGDHVCVSPEVRDQASADNAEAVARRAGSHPTVDTLLKLRNVGIDFSVPETDLRQWLSDSEFTPYPAISTAVLDLLEGKRLRQPVYLDVIVWNYEHAPGAASPRRVADVDVGRLRAAVLEGHNERYGEAVRDFQTLVR